jgi:D-proline reductase (dithiol) PrdB
MTERRRTHRSHLSYIDKSREFYGAHGYPQAYQWATNDDAPFTPLPKPLSECRIGAITTSYFLPDDFVYRIPSDLPRKPHVADRSQVDHLDNQHLSWAKDETNTDDPESFLPLARLDEAAADGRIGSVSDRFYCLPTQFSHRQTQRRDTPQLLEWLREDHVDAVVMVPL